MHGVHTQYYHAQFIGISESAIDDYVRVCVGACVCVICHFLLITNIHNKHVAYHNSILSLLVILVAKPIPKFGLVAFT